MCCFCYCYFCGRFVAALASGLDLFCSDVVVHSRLVLNSLCNAARATDGCPRMSELRESLCKLQFCHLQLFIEMLRSLEACSLASWAHFQFLAANKCKVGDKVVGRIFTETLNQYFVGVHQATAICIA